MKENSITFDETCYPRKRSYFSVKGHPYLEKLRKQYKIDEIIKNETSEIDKIIALTDWVHSRWEHDGLNEPKKHDAIAILEEAEQGEKFRCVEYSTVLTATLSSIGVPSRSLGLMMKTVETRKSGAGHAVVEAYIQSLKKWIIVDCQENLLVTVAEEPLNAVELCKELNTNGVKRIVLSNKKAEKGEYLRWIKRYLYYFSAMMDNRYGIDTPVLPILRLGPAGSIEPKVFQRTKILGKAEFTNNVDRFYPEPEFR